MTERHRVVPAVYLAPLRDGEVLLLRRRNTGFRDGEYSLVAGHVERGETFREAMVREAREEVGIGLDRAHLSFAHALHRDADDGERVDVFFTATEWTGTVTNEEPEKCAALSWSALDDLPPDVIPYVEHVLVHLGTERCYSERGWR